MSDQTVGRIEQLAPGPWDRGPMNGDAIDIITPTDQPWVARVVARVPALHTKAEAEARLIAAAPELLAACKAVLAQFDAGTLQRNTDNDGGEDWAIRAIEPLNALSLMAGAVAKAEGRS